MAKEPLKPISLLILELLSIFSNMDMVKKLFQMVMFIKGNIRMEGLMERERILGCLSRPLMKEVLKMD